MTSYFQLCLTSHDGYQHLVDAGGLAPLQLVGTMADSWIAAERLWASINQEQVASLSLVEWKPRPNARPISKRSWVWSALREGELENGAQTTTPPTSKRRRLYDASRNDDDGI